MKYRTWEKANFSCHLKPWYPKSSTERTQKEERREEERRGKVRRQEGLGPGIEVSQTLKVGRGARAIKRN